MKIPAPQPEGEARLEQHIKAEKLPPSIREWRFHPIRAWRFDFAWPALKVAVEVDGVTPTIGRHQRPKGYAEDCRKLNSAALLGWKVFRFTPAMVKSGEAIKILSEALSHASG